jgi:hypothetical protein
MEWAFQTAIAPNLTKRQCDAAMGTAIEKDACSPGLVAKDNDRFTGQHEAERSSANLSAKNERRPDVRETVEHKAFDLS